MTTAVKGGHVLRGFIGAVVLAGTWLGLAASAQAADIILGSTPPFSAFPLLVLSDPGEINHIEVFNSGAGYVVRETGSAPLNNSAPSCVPSGPPKRYFCTLSNGGAPPTPLIHVALGDMNDTFRGSLQPIPITVFGGTGDDTLISGAGVQGSLDGEAGFDTVDYS